MTEPMLSFVLSRLPRDRARLLALAEVTGLPYETLSKLARGVVANPRIRTLQPLYDHLQREAAIAAGVPALGGEDGSITGSDQTMPSCPTLSDEVGEGRT